VSIWPDLNVPAIDGSTALAGGWEDPRAACGELASNIAVAVSTATAIEQA
jgi:hypothetical protein